MTQRVADGQNQRCPGIQNDGGKSPVRSGHRQVLLNAFSKLMLERRGGFV
jgi:hypothetical protein